MNTRRVLHISKYYYPFRGGIEQIAQDFVNALKGEYEQKVICFNDSSANITEIIDGIEIIRCGVISTIASQGIAPTIGHTLKTLIDSFCPDIIVFHYPNPYVARYLLKFIQKEAKLVLYRHLDIVK